MQTRAAFPLWTRLHQDLLGFLDQLPDAAKDLAAAIAHIAEVEDFWRRRILDPAATLNRIESTDRMALRGACERIFTALEGLLANSRLDALAARPIESPYPVRNALEALSLCHLHTVHHRAHVAAGLRAAGVALEEWI